jgi:hypothetical protein
MVQFISVAQISLSAEQPKSKSKQRIYFRDVSCVVDTRRVRQFNARTGATPDQPTSVTADPRLRDQSRPGLVMTDNPYTISSDRLEKMNKGGFEAY